MEYKSLDTLSYTKWPGFSGKELRIWRRLFRKRKDIYWLHKLKTAQDQ